MMNEGEAGSKIFASMREWYGLLCGLVTFLEERGEEVPADLRRAIPYVRLAARQSEARDVPDDGNATCAVEGCDRPGATEFFDRGVATGFCERHRSRFRFELTEDRLGFEPVDLVDGALPSGWRSAAMRRRRDIESFKPPNTSDAELDSIAQEWLGHLVQSAALGPPPNVSDDDLLNPLHAEVRRLRNELQEETSRSALGEDHRAAKKWAERREGIELADPATSPASIETHIIVEMLTGKTQLAEREAQVVRLRLQGCSYLEIAETLDITASTARTCHGRAVEKLRAAAGL